MPVERSCYHYRSRRAGQAPLSKRIKEIAETRVRYGYRQVHVLQPREGWAVNAKRMCRLYREQGQQLRNKSPRRRVKAKLRDDRAAATAAAHQFLAMVRSVGSAARIVPKRLQRGHGQLAQFVLGSRDQSESRWEL